MDTTSDSKRIDRVILACIQCRGRHVKCDATQPICNRCKREGKECIFQKSRRGGLDKAALARRRLRLQQEAEGTKQSPENVKSANNEFVPSLYTISSPMGEHLPINPTIDVMQIESQLYQQNLPAFQVSNDRLLELFFENFWPSFPVVIPYHYLQARRLDEIHNMDELLLVLHWIGSIYAPWTPSEPYYEAALQAISSIALPRTPFSVQALMLFAVAQCHSDRRHEAQKKVNLAVAIAIELRMNQKGFAQMYGEANPVLEESWRRTYYMLNVVDQHFAIISNSPIYTLLSMPNLVDLPCDDEFYESGKIPSTATWHDYENREFAEVEIIYSSLVYLYDMAKVVANVMNMFIESGTFGEHIVDSCDAKLAIWSSLLPACKKDPLHKNGQVDEVMFMAHMIAAVTISTMHRPFSSLKYGAEEMNTEAFLSPTPFVMPPGSGRNAHTARALKAVEMQTKLLAIPCAVEKHNVFTMCICAQLAAVQVSACNNLLEDKALSIARDRVRLSIGFLNAMGSIWPLGKKMAKEVRAIARSNLSSVQNTVATESGPATEIDLLRDELIWPIDPSAQIDIYSGIVLWDTANFGNSSSTSSSLT